MHCYADDTQVYLSFKPGSISSEESAFSAIQSCISAIRSWLLTNKLLINDTKTEFLIIGTRQQLSKVQTDSISVGESRISSSKEVRNLGTWLDNTLSMSTQVSKVASSCFYYIYNIRRIRKYLSREVCETLVNSLITSRLDYCNSLLYGCPSPLLARLQQVQNSAARLIYNVSRTFSSSPQRSEDRAKFIETSKLPMKDIASMCGVTLKTAYNVKQRISAGESIEHRDGAKPKRCLNKGDSPSLNI